MNKVYHGDFLTNSLPDKSVQLIIADPPYYEVKGDFDFIWTSFADYQKDVEKWAIECKRLLADNGTLFWYGHALKIAYSQVILDKYFSLVNSLVWEKKECQTMKCSPSEMRTFAPVTERILMYSNKWDINGLNEIAEKPGSYLPIKQYMREQKKLSGLTAKKSYEICGVFTVDRHCFGDSQWEMITRENYEKLQKATGYFQKPYESLRTEYESLRRPFNQTKLQTDVLKYSQESHITKQYDHETKKPETLTRALILTCSRPNDFIFVPFAGSGTECAMEVKEGRRCIGYDINNKHVETACERILKHQQTPTLF
jgi:site-specific DNA-methyltransferase (adenine-specific)